MLGRRACRVHADPAVIHQMIDDRGVCRWCWQGRAAMWSEQGSLAQCQSIPESRGKHWLQTLVRNIDYAFKAKRYVPIDSDSIDDLADIGGWHSGQTADKLMNTSWMMAVLAGWCAALGLDESYRALRHGLTKEYPEVCAQLWHPDKGIHDHLYFQAAHFISGASEAPIRLPESMDQWLEHMRVIVASVHGEECLQTMGCKSGLPALDLIACRHFGTPITNAFSKVLKSGEEADKPR